MRKKEYNEWIIIPKTILSADNDNNNIATRPTNIIGNSSTKVTKHPFTTVC